MAGLFCKEISLFGFLLYCIVPGAVLTTSVSNFEVQNHTVGSDVKFSCHFDHTSLLTSLRYSPNVTGSARMSMLGFSEDGQFKIGNKSYVGRIVVGNSSRIILRNVTVRDSGFYKCRIEYSTGEEKETKVHLKIGVAPTIEPLSDIEILEETSLKVVCNTQGLPAPDVIWFRTIAEEAGVVRASHILEVKNIEISQSGVYHCSARNYMGNAEKTLRIKVYKKPSVREFFHVGTLDGIVWQCQNVKLICDMAPNYSPMLHIHNYRLYQNGMLIMKQSNSGVFRISRVGLDHEGTYTCVPETRLGLGRNKTLRLYVKAAPKLCKELTPTPSSNFSSYASSTAEPVSFAQPNETARTGSSMRNAGTSTSFVIVLTSLLFSMIV